MLFFFLLFSFLPRFARRGPRRAGSLSLAVPWLVDLLIVSDEVADLHRVVLLAYVKQKSFLLEFLRRRDDLEAGGGKLARLCHARGRAGVHGTAYSQHEFWDMRPQKELEDARSTKLATICTIHVSN